MSGRRMLPSNRSHCRDVQLYEKSSFAGFEMPLTSEIGVVEMGKSFVWIKRPVVFGQVLRRHGSILSESSTILITLLGKG